MTYAQRNNLTMLVILMLLMGGSLFWYRAEKKTLRNVKVKFAELKARLAGDMEVTHTFRLFTSQRDSLMALMEQLPKKLIFEREPAFSLRYINQLIKNNRLNIDFDFFLSSKKDNKSFTTYTYKLTGETDYPNFYSLVWLLTKYPILYQIKNVTLKRNSTENDQITFTMVLQSYAMNGGGSQQSPFKARLASLRWAQEFSHNAFKVALPPKPKVIQPRPKPVVKRVEPPEPPGLLDVTRSRLIAIAADQIYVRDQNGEMKSLRVGDRVKRGFLVQIDPLNNRAYFRLRTPNGGSRVVTMNLVYK